MQHSVHVVALDHVHLLVGIPPKLSVFGLMGVLKGRYRHTNFYGLSVFEEETPLGQSLLGETVTA